MHRGNLKCNATNCAHNQDYECKAGNIHVSGLGAISIEGTNCTTFTHIDNSSFLNCLNKDPNEKESFFNSSNSSFVDNPSNSTTHPCDIKCEAHNCKYNKNKDCSADFVQIDSLNACCDSFDYGKHI
ncbi:DUF1540 domain-containing protein [Terrisporobacter sp.]